MPKVKRNSNLVRAARRRVTTSENLSSSVTRNFRARNGVANQIRDYRASPPLKEEIISPDKKSNGTQGNDKIQSLTHDRVNDGTNNTQTLSRGQRKRQAKREQFLRKEKMILSSLMLKRQEEQKKRIDGLDAIKKALMDTEETDRNGQPSNNDTKKPELNLISSIKAKRKLVANEIEHVNLILQHPAFKKDPFTTMQEHLRNSFSEDRKYKELLSKRRIEAEGKKNRIRKKSQKKKYKPRRTR